MLETLVALVGLLFAFLYLYDRIGASNSVNNSDDENPEDISENDLPDGNSIFRAVARLVFLFMALWTGYILIWVAFSDQTVTTTVAPLLLNTTYDNATDVITYVYGNATTTATTAVDGGVHGSLIAYLDAYTWVIYLVLGLVVVLFLYNVVAYFIRRGKQNEAKFP